MIVQWMKYLSCQNIHQEKLKYQGRIQLCQKEGNQQGGEAAFTFRYGQLAYKPLYKYVDIPVGTMDRQSINLTIYSYLTQIIII